MTTMRTFLSGLLLLSACGTHSAIEASHLHSQLGDDQRAFQVLDEALAAERKSGVTPDPELEKAHAKARLAFLLARARQRIFEEQEDAALEDLATLASLAPDYPETAELRDRALLKKAQRSVKLGDDFMLRKDLHNALANYLAALRVVPDFPPAVQGSDDVRTALRQLSERAQRQFLEAVRKMPEFRFVEVRWHTDIAMANDPERDDADQLRLRAQRELALRAQERGMECQAEDKFGAALLEFRTARKLDTTLPGIDDLVAQAEREVEAAALVERSQRSMRMGQFDLAREQLGKAFALSTMARTGIGELVVQAKRMEGEVKYEAARDLETLGKKAEALAAFEALSKEWPEGLLDEKGRIEALRIDIEGAKTEWAAGEAAEKASDPVKALLHYEAAMQYYPGWRDGQQRIERLKRKVAPKPGAGAARTPPAK